MNSYQRVYPQCLPANMRSTGEAQLPFFDTLSATDEIDDSIRCLKTVIQYYEFPRPKERLHTDCKLLNNAEGPSTSETEPWNDQTLGSTEVQSMSRVAEYFPKVFADIERIRSRARDWGKVGAENPSNETLDYAYEVISELVSYAGKIGRSLPAPAVGRCADGSILFEWDFKQQSFELELSRRGKVSRLTYLLCPDEEDDSTWEEGEIGGGLTEHPGVRRFLSWS